MLQLLFTLAQEQDAASGKFIIEMNHLISFVEYLLQVEFKGQLLSGID